MTKIEQNRRAVNEFKNYLQRLNLYDQITSARSIVFAKSGNVTTTYRVHSTSAPPRKNKEGTYFVRWRLANGLATRLETNCDAFIDFTGNKAFPILIDSCRVANITNRELHRYANEMMQKGKPVKYDNWLRVWAVPVKQ